MQEPNSRVLRVVFVAVAVLLVGSCKDSDGGGSGSDTCGGDECKLVASDSELESAFGFSVAVSGDEVVVGSSLSSPNGLASGAVYAFRRDGSRFTEVQKVAPDDGEAGDRFGVSVALEGDVLAVGAPSAVNPFTDDATGAVYMYRLIDGEWTFEQELLAFEGNDGDGFGRSVAVSGDFIVIGAFRDTVATLEKAGSGYIYEYDGIGTWVIKQKISAPDRGLGDFFGISVGIDGPVVGIAGGTIAVGSIGDDDSGVDSGAAYAFSYNGTTWDFDQKIKALREPLACETPTLKDDAYPRDTFGISVDVEGGRIVVGADATELRVQNAACGLIVPSNANGVGTTYVYQETAPDSGVWAYEAKLEPSDFSPQQRFGHSVALSGTNLLIGSRDDSTEEAQAGSAYAFVFDGMDWVESEKLQSRDAKAFDWFGQSVAVDGDDAVTGAYGDDQGGPLAGAAYVFGL